MLQSIYASKLYRTSSRKSRIKASAESSLNAELVTQLAHDLDEEYQTDEYLATEQDKAQSAPEGGSPDGGDGASEGGASEGGFGGGPSGGHGGGSFGGDLGSAPGEFVEEDAPAGGEGDESDIPDDSASESSDDSSDVAESTKIKGKKVTASSDTSTFKDMGQVADQIKGLLNFKDSTSGVSRTLVKENELWIYYNDDMNLNNIMAIVIDTLNGSGYTYLEFNRLARSDNAIVFEIAFKSSDNQVKPKQEPEVEEPEIDEQKSVIEGE